MRHEYREDIDGLRAISVLPVIAYHLDIPFVAAGYAGVDVFFVISGYLVTSVLLRSPSTVSAAVRFYWRRAARLFPSVFVLLTVCLAAGAFIMLPSEFRNLGRDAGASTLLAANLVLARNTDYFDPSANFNVLLHMWSLCVEEQFYLLLPLLLAVILRGSNAMRFVIIAAAFVLSF